MADWEPGLYLTFEKERTRPSADLTAQIKHGGPKRIIDIGCGPGNSTLVLKRRWPGAEITGLDNSEPMLGRARLADADINWVLADASGDLSCMGAFDIVFSNAAIQWIPGQRALLENLYGMLSPGGILAVQVPCLRRMPVSAELQKLAARPEWAAYFQNLKGASSVHTADFYYDVLCGLTRTIDLWQTSYFHMMENHGEIINWYSGSGLRPYLDRLPEESVRAAFLAELESALKKSYPAQKDGRILFPFDRIFFTAGKA